VENLSLQLWRERELLEELLFRLEVEQLVLADGRSRWLARAASDVQELLEELRKVEVIRAGRTDEAAAELGMAPNPSLLSLADAVPDPWRSILISHRDGMIALTTEISAMADTNRHLITAGYQSAREVLVRLDSTDSYTPEGAAVTAPTGPRLVDRSL
jgi:hypothetical protein